MNPITLFPDTGHFFAFVPHEKATFDEGFLQKWLICTGRPWAHHPSESWVRFRPGYNDGVIGLWIAVESNLGERDRGIAVEPKRQVQEVPVDQTKYDEFWTPYAYRALDQLPPNGITKIPNVVIADPDDSSKRLCEFPLPEIHWWPNGGDHPIPVDLVVDFGNTRTAALLFEDDETRPLNEICRPLRFLPRGRQIASSQVYSIDHDPLVMVESWIVLRQGIFSNLEPPHSGFKPSSVLSVEQRQQSGWLKSQNVNVVVAEQRYLPQMFVEISPCIMGGGMGVDSARQILKDADMEVGSNFFLSSPKRYIWDGDQQGKRGRSYWTVERMPWSQPTTTGLPRLEGPIMLHMDTDGRYWDLNNDEAPCERSEYKHRPKINDNATFPRRDAMTWAALTIIEAAHRQINSEDYRRARNPTMMRKLRDIVVTFPAGWTSQEIDVYRSQWQKAINVFTVAHKPKNQRESQGNDRLTLRTDLDEAVASQLPIIFSENQRMPSGEGWIELMGKGNGTDAKTRVMNIDIGGGTCDVAVVEYKDTYKGIPVELKAALLFKNSNNVAGDRLVQEVIERVLLPLIGRRFVNDNKLLTSFEQLFRNPSSFSHFDPAIRVKLSRAVRLVFLPIIYDWLSELSHERMGIEGSKSINEIVDANGSQMVDLTVLSDFNQLFRRVTGNKNIDLLEPDESLKYDGALINRCVSDVFKPLIKTFAKIVSAFDCDQIYVSGKTSELPEIRRLIHRYMPLLEERVVFARGYFAGDWYPYGAKVGTIADAKTLTVVGAALVQAIRKRRINDWDIEISQEFILSEDNYWGLLSDSSKHALFEDSLFLRPGENQVSTRMPINSRIGRARFLSPILDPDQIYVLRWKPEANLPENCPTMVEVTIQRKKAKGQGESLNLVGVKVADRACNVTLDHIELQLCTLPDGEFWMDNPKFEVVWNTD